MSEALTLETLDFDAYQDSPKKESIISLSIKGSIRKIILNKMVKSEVPFPVKSHLTQESIIFYILNRRKRVEQKKREGDDKLPILLFTRIVHRKEIARIRKASTTIEKNVESELVSKEGVDLNRVCRFIQIMWIQDEFYISKEVIRKHLNALGIFYKSCGIRKLKKVSVSHAK